MLRIVGLVGILVLWGGIAAAQPGNAQWHLNTATPQDLPLESLSIRSGDQVHTFMVEVAVTPDQRQIGMMFEDYLAPDRGMLFDNGRLERSTFWMRNTFISLDLLFIHADGRIENIAHEAVPLTTTRIPATAPVRAVLEIAGGRARELGLRPGDIVVHPLFGNSE